jgi:hypothetical protein
VSAPAAVLFHSSDLSEGTASSEGLTLTGTDDAHGTGTS